MSVSRLAHTIAALGGELQISATFDDVTVPIKLGNPTPAQTHARHPDQRPPTSIFLLTVCNDNARWRRDRNPKFSRNLRLSAGRAPALDVVNYAAPRLA